MKNKVYYGEYTLKHWIRLILREEIVMPEYQVISYGVKETLSN